jgi:N12 class adenine-specific DNA methylase
MPGAFDLDPLLAPLPATPPLGLGAPVLKPLPPPPSWRDAALASLEQPASSKAPSWRDAALASLEPVEQLNVVGSPPVPPPLPPLAQKPDLTQPGILPNETAPQHLARLNELHANEGFVGGVKELGRSVARGVRNLPETVQESGQFFGRALGLAPPATADELARLDAEKTARAEAAPDWMKESLTSQAQEHPWGSLAEAGESLVPSLGPAATGAAIGAGLTAWTGPGAAVGAIGGAAIGGVLGILGMSGQQGEETYRKVTDANIKAGLSPEDAHEAGMHAGLINASIEGAGEVVSTLLLAKAGALIPPSLKLGVTSAIAKRLGMAGADASADVVQRAATNQGAILRAAKDIAFQVAPAEIATEMGQQAGEQGVESLYGAGAMPTWDDAKRVVVPTLVMTAFGAGGAHAFGAYRRSEANRLLTDPAAGTPQERQAVVDTVARSVQQEDPELARIFRAYASASVAANLPVAIDQDAAYREVAARAAVANPTLTDAQAKQAAVDATAAETDPQDLQRVAAATAAALANRPKTGPLTRAAQTAGPPNVSQNAVQQAAGAGQAGPPAGQAVGGGARPVPPAGPAPGAASGTNVGVAAVRGADGAAVQPGALRPGSGVDDLGYPTEGAGRTPGPSGPQGGPSGLGGMDPNAGLTTAPGPLTLQGQDEARAAGALYGSNVGAVLPGAGTKQTGKGYDPKVPPGSPIADPAVRKRLDDWWTNINEPAPTQPTPTEDPNAPSSPPPSPTPTPEVKPPRDTGAAPGAPDTPAADQGKEPTKEENGRRYQVGAKSLTARELAGRLAEFRTESVDDLERSVRARPGPWIKVLEDREASARLDKDAEQKARPVALNEKQRRLVDQAREWNTRFFDPRNPLERALPHPEDTADKQRMMRHLVNLGVVSRYVDQETGVIGWQVQDQRIAPAADQGETPAAKGGGTPAPMPTGFKVRNLRTGRFLKDGITGKDAVLQDRDHAQKVADDSERDSHLNAKATNSIRPSKFAVVDLSDEVTAPEPPTTGTKPTPALSPKAQAARDAGYADGLAGKPEPAASLVPRRQGWKEGKAARDAAGATTVETPVVTQPTPTVKELTPEPTTPAPTDKESLTVAARSYDDWLKAFSSDVAAGRLPDTAPLNDLRNRHIKEAARLLEGVANVTGYDAEDGRFITDDQGHFQTVGAIDERRAAAARVQPQIAQLRHELASGYSALRDARASQSHAKLVERQQQEADQRREDQKKAREEQKARDEAERRKPVPPSAREIELNDLETKVRARLADLRRQGRERRDAGESNEALTTEYQPQISEGQQHLKWIAEHGFDRFHQGQLVSSTYIGAKYGEIPQDLIDFANSAPTPAPEGAAAGAKAQKPKLPNKQRAAQQKVASVMGAAPGDTVTFSDFASGQMDYLSPDKPYVLESVTARGYGDAELHFVSATGSGTSVALARIVAAQRQVGATWQVAKKVSAQPDAGPDGATPAAPEPAAAATPATPEPPTAKTPAAKTPAEAAPAQPPEQPQPAPAYGASNTLVTADRAAELRKRLKAKLSQLNAGIDPEILAIGAELAAFHLEAGARSFAAFAKRIAEDLGEPLPKLRPYLRSWYNGARDMMEDAGISIDGMDDPQTVKAELARIFTQQPATLTAEPQPEPTNGPPTDTPDQAGERPDRRDGLADRGPEGTGDDRPVAADSPADGGTIGTGGDFGGVRAPDREPPVRGERGEPESGDGLAGQSGGSEQGLVDRGPGRPRGSKRPGRGPNAAAGDGGTGAGAAVGAGAGAEDQTGAGGTVEPVTPDEPSTTLDLAARAENFHADEPERIYGGTPKVRFNKNRRAIEVYRELEEAGRNATADERDILAGYTGWGSFGQELFQGTWERTVEREGWRNEDDWLRGHLGESEWKAAQASIINAHYTDPPTVQAIWAAVQRLGFQGGRVLEPAAGVGNFFAMMPKAVQDASQLTGIELDELSSGILKHLYPNATISNKPYQESQTPDGFYDLVIGNWPFASTGPADRRYNKLSPSLHDYFFLKALDQVRAGGLVVGITSRYSLDGKGNAVRQALARKADLVAAYRLPSGAFKEYAGTAVVTDLIILKKRETENTDPQSSAWTQTEDLDLGADGQKAAINRYYLLNRDNILGELGWGSGTTYGRAGVIVERGDDFPERLAAMADEMTTGTYTPANNAKHIRYITNNTTERSRAVVIGADGDLYQTQGERLVNLHDVVPWQVKDAKKTAKRDAQLRGLVGLRKAYGRLIDAERDGAPDTEALRKTLREQYEAFRDAHGPVRESEGIRLLDKAEDPFYPSLMALERVRDGVIEPMPILHRSVVRTSAKIDRPTVRDAYVVERNQGLHIDMARIATAAGVPVEQAEQDLVTAGAVYRLPGGGYEPSDVYLGGNVRRKLREAQAAAEQGEEMARNIEHLEKVIPKDVPYFNIEAKLGAQWVGAKHYRDFVAEVIIGNADVAENLELEWRINRWVVKPSDAHQDTPTALRWTEVNAYEEGFTVDGRNGAKVPMLNEDGTPLMMLRDSGRVRLRQLLEAAFNNGTMKFTAKDDDGNTYTREAFSAAANERAGAIREAFEEWVWKSPERKVALERDYNEVMNAIADPQFDGSFLAFDGMALQRGDNEFDLRSHQSNAIWRGLVQGSGLYAHEVGTGKTYTIGGISVESRRFGLAQKPLILAHNANSASVAAEIQEMYPGAKVLYVNNLDSSRVKETMAQIRNDDWDAVVMPHSLLDRLTLKRETLNALAAEDIAALESAFWEAMDEGDENQAGFGRAVHADMMDDEEAIKKLRNPTAKELANARLRIKAQIEKQAQQSSREDAIAFEDLGVDMLIVDEAHLFKKPPMATRMKMRGLQKQISNRSVALKFLTDYIKGQHAGRGVHLFTGTPITNTLAEIFHMQRYVMQQDMARDGIDQWDSWFNTFASGVSDVEFTAAGDYQPVTKLAGFINVAELRRMMSPYMDVVFADEMPEFTPRKTASGKTLADEGLTADEIDTLQNGRQENPVGRPYKKVVMDVAEMSPEQAAILARLQKLAAEWRSAGGKQRMEWMKSGDPHSPIMIEGAAARAGMDARMEDLSLPDHPESKVNRAVRNLLHHYRGEPEAAQVVFMDKGYSDTRTVAKVRVPGHNLAKELRTKLIAEGVPAHEIAIVAGGVTPEQKKAVADAVNSGTVRIVIGQTETLGTGVNMQRRLRAMHHLDAPWMPGELEQRNGRGWRQGNTWNTVLEYRYITERIDGKRWQVLAVKDRFIKAFLHADADTRVIEGDAVSDDEGGGYAETLSEAVGDPRLLQRQKLTVDVQKLQRRERTHAQGVVEAREKLARNERLVPEKEAQAKRYDADADLFEQAEAVAGERQQDAYREEVAVYVDGLGLKLTAAERAAVRADGWGNKQTDRELAKRVQAAVKAAEAEGNQRPKEPTTKPFDARLLNDRFTTRDAFNEAEKTLNQRMPQGAGWIPVGELFGFPLEAHRVGRETVYLQVASLTEPGVRYGVYGAITDTLRGLRGTGRQVRAEAANLRADRPKLEELADQPFARAKDLERKQARLAEIEADMARNPVPAPAWLRHGAPVDTLAYVKGKEVVVEGHQWADDGYFVHVLDGERARRVPYLDLRDANGERKYTEHPFVAPSGANVAAADALPAGVWVVELANRPAQAPRWINVEDLAQLKAHGTTVRRATASDWQALSLWERMNRPAGIGEQVLDALGAMARGQRARAEAARAPAVPQTPEQVAVIASVEPSADQKAERAAVAARAKKAYLAARLTLGQYEAARALVRGGETARVSRALEIVETTGRQPSLAMMAAEAYKMEVDVDRILALTGPSMYSGGFAETALKEMAQNAVDAAATNTKGTPTVLINIDSQQRLITVADNGNGMLPREVRSKFFTLGGSGKTGVGTGGGFGLGKAIFLMGSEWVELSTVKGTKRTTARVTPAHLLGKGGKKITPEVTEVPAGTPSGTVVRIKVPESYVSERGEASSIYMPWDLKQVEMFQNFMLAPVEVLSTQRDYAYADNVPSLTIGIEALAREFGYGARPEPIKTGLRTDFEGTQLKKYTRMNFSWGTADLYLGQQREDWPKHAVLSNGIYQFDPSFMVRLGERVPYAVVLDVHSSVKADDPSYPFNNQRQGFRSSIEEDNAKLRDYIAMVARGADAQATAQTFSDMQQLPRMEVDTDEPAPNVPRAPVEIKRPKPTGKGLEAAPAVVTIDNTGIKVPDKKAPSGLRELTVPSLNERRAPGSMQAERAAPVQEDFLKAFDLDVSKPVYHNNTNVDWIAEGTGYGDAGALFAELGTVAVQLREVVGKLKMYGFAALDSDKTPVFTGISIDKEYRGVHIRVPAHALFLNPLALPRHLTTLRGVTQAYYKTLVHELAHTRSMKHDESFVLTMHEIEERLSDDGTDMEIVERLADILARHEAVLTHLRSIYDQSTTRNVAQSLEKQQKDAASQGWAADDLEGPGDAGGGTRTGADAGRWGTGGRGLPGRGDREDQGDTGDGDASAVGGDGTEVDGSVRPRFALGGAAPNFALAQHRISRPRAAGVEPVSVAWMQARADADPLVRVLRERHGVTVRVLADESGLGAEALAELARVRRQHPEVLPKATWVPGSGAGGRGEILLVAGNLRDGREGLRLILEEGVGHFGLTALLGPQFGGFLDTVVRDFNPDVAAWARAYGLDMQDQGERRRAAEEFLAHNARFAADAPRGLLERVYEAIKDALRALGWTLRLTDGDLRGVLAAARRFVETGRGATGVRARVGGPVGARATGARGMFAGQGARTADAMALATAQARLAAGEDDETVRKATGWHQGADGKWRFEIDDSSAVMMMPVSAISEYTNLPLPKVIAHDALFAAYPMAETIRVMVSSGTKEKASYDPLSRTIALRDDTKDADALSFMLHEIQHYVQTSEGLASGVNPKNLSQSDNVYLIDGVNWRDIDWSLVFHILEQIPTDTEMTKRRYVVSFSDEEKKTILAKMEKERKAAIKKAATAKRQHAKQENTKNAESLGAAIQLLESKNAFTVEAKETRIDRYWRTSGEVEARNTEARRALTAAERRATVPSATQDVPDTDVIVTFNGREMASAPRPANAGEPANPDIRFALAPPADSGGSPLGGGRALMDSIREVIDRTGEWAGGRWRQALPTTLGAVTLRQLADLGAAHIPGIKGYLAAQQRMDTRRNEMTEESGVFAEETWQAWARKREHRVAAEALASLMHDATREQVDPADYKVLEVALKLGPSDLFWRTRQATEANVRELERQARQMVGGEPTAQDVADLMRERQQQPGAPTDPKALRAAVLATWKAGAGRAEDRGMSGYYVAAAQQLKAAVATQKARERALPALQARWNALSPQAQEIYRTSRDMFTKRSAAMVDALEARVMALEGIDEARKRALAAKMRADFEAPFDEKGNPRIGPYFPLQRFGRFYLFARRFPTGAARTFRKQDGGLFASEDAARNALKRRDLKGVEARAVAVSDPTSGEISGWELQEIGDPGFWMAESIAERRQLAAELRGQGWTVERQGLTKEARKELEGVSEGFIAEAVELLRSKGSGKEADELYQLYLGTLQQMSIRKHFVHRKGTTGYSNDALRSFAWNMTRLASQVAKLEHVPTLERILRDIEDDKKERQRVLVAEGGDVTVADAFLEELKKRHQWVVAPDNAPWTNFTSALGFFWYLGATPAAALVNVTQTPIMALPILASRYGWGAASRALGAAAVDVARGFTPAVLKGYLVGRAHGGLPANLSDDERRAVDEWALSGVQDRTQAHNLAGIGDSDSFVNGPAFNRVMAVISSGFHAAEVFNRDATLLAGYRLAREKGASHRDAVQAAEADTWIAHFDYGNSNRARWMQSNAAKALLMFRSYSQHVLYFLWRNLYQGLKGESVEVRRQARTQLLGSLGMTGLFAGALGLPLMGTVFMVANLAAAAFGDDDEPWDAEIAFRNWLAETFPDSIATALDRGAVTAATGLDWSSRVGMQTLVWRAPDRDLDGEASYFYVVEQLLGPLGGIFASPWEAADLVAEGQWQRAAETLAPKALKDVLRAGRFATEGVVSMKGAPIVERDELNAYQIAWKAMGMNPDAVAVRQDANAAVKLYEGRILDRRSRLMTAYAMAVIHQDADGQANLLPKIRAFNLAQPMIPITPRSIRTSVRNRTRAVDEAAYGMSVNRRLRETVGAAGAFGG